MGTKEIEIAGKKLIIHELQDVCHPSTGAALTGSWLWDSAVYLSNWMASQGQLQFPLQGKMVIELGAGTGLPGLVAASFGAGRVILTDIASLLPGLQRSVDANGLGDRVEVRELVWGSDTSFGGKVDLVLMSDVFYDASEMPALAKTLKQLCGDGTRIWSASEVRAQTQDCLKLLKEEGLEVVELPLASTKAEADHNLEASVADKATFALFLMTPPGAL